MPERTIGHIVERAGIADASINGDPATVVRAISLDSRRVRRGMLFCCVRGAQLDGHAFAAGAVSNGASALLVDHPLALDVTQVVVADTRAAMGRLAAAFYDFPARRLTMVGVTGTNGKTTTTSLIRSILRHAGQCTEMIGTLTGVRTTPEAPDLQRQLAEFVAVGTQAVVMEVSSHALALDRVVGAHFDRALFTNLGRDHLDLHGTEEQYFAAKARLFTADLSTSGVANVDDLHGRLLVDTSPIPMEGFGLGDVVDVEVSATGHAYRWRGQRIEVAIGGEFNVLNSLAAATVCASLGLEPAEIAAGLTAADAVPGRFEAIDEGQPFAVIVDFAHTPEALGAAITAARRSSPNGRVIVVFGAGGDRDREKRAAMGAIAAERADLVVVTSDNPRHEDPQAIADAVIAGIPGDRRHAVVTELDRRQAFGAAFTRTTPGDVVLIAGKGHERTQTIGDRIVEFDDRVVAREVLRELTERLRRGEPPKRSGGGEHGRRGSGSAATKPGGTS